MVFPPLEEQRGEPKAYLFLVSRQKNKPILEKFKRRKHSIEFALRLRVNRLISVSLEPVD